MKWILFVSILFLISLSTATLCTDTTSESDIPCDIITPVLTCSTNATILNTGNGSLFNFSMTSQGDGTYKINFTLGIGSYSVVACDNSTTHFEVTEDTQTGPVSEGGTGIDPFLSQVTEDLCRRTYDYINEFGRDDVSHIYVLLDQINKETGEVESYSIIKKYIDNWEAYCSEKILRTLSEKEVCSASLEFLNKEKGQYSLVEINELRKELEPEIKISNEVLSYYIENNKELCSSFTLSLAGFTGESASCTPETPILFDYSIPLVRIDIGETGCNAVTFWKWLVELEKTDNQYTITGIKAWWVILVIIGIIGTWIYRRRKDEED